MIAISAKITISPDFADAYVKAALAIIPSTRKEAGCNYYAFGRDIEDSNVVLISEEWTSEQALRDHLKSPHITDFLEKTQSMKLQAVEVKKYDVRSVGGL